jgi:hypothetical protein
MNLEWHTCQFKRKNLKMRKLFYLLIISALILFSFGLTYPTLAQDAAETELPATVFVAHLAPFADVTVPGSTTVVLCVDGVEVLDAAEFPNIYGPLELTPGEHHIEIFPPGSGELLAEAIVMVESGKTYTLAVIGDGVNQPLEIVLLEQETISDPENAKLFLGHYAPLASLPEGTAVDICSYDGTPLLTNFVYKDGTNPYLLLAPGDYDLEIRFADLVNPCDGDLALEIPFIRLGAGDIVDLFAVGGVNGAPLTLISTTGFEYSPAASAFLAHFAPFGDATVPASTSVTVRVDGVDALTNFEFGTIFGPSVVSAGEHLVEVIPTGGTTPALSGTIYLMPELSYTVAVIGDGVNQPLELLVVERDTVPDATQAKLFLGHVAPFANTLPGTAVDICTDDGDLVLANVVYKQYTDPYLLLAPGDYDLAVRLADLTTPCGGGLALDLPSIRLDAGDIVDIWVIGLANGWPLSTGSTTGFELTPTEVDIAHFAPFAEASIPASTSVTVRVDGVDVLTGVEFGAIAQNIEMSPGDHLIEVIPTGSVTPVISSTVTLEDGTVYTLAVIGDGTNQPLEMLVVEQETIPNPTQAKLFLGHVAPFANTIPGTAVDICTDAGVPLLTDFVYREYTDPYLLLAPGDYDLEIRLAALPPCSGGLGLDIPSIRLEAGDIVDLWAIGLANGWPLGLGSTTGYTLSPSVVDVAHFAPFGQASIPLSTEVSVWVDGVELLTGVEFREIFQDFELAPGDHLIEVFPTGSLTPAMSSTVTVTAGMEYTVAAIGDGTNQPLEVFVMPQDNTLPAVNMARVRIAHLAPFAPVVDDTRIDICYGDNTLLLADMLYKDVTDPYLVLPKGFYNMRVAMAGTGCTDLVFELPMFYLKSQQVVSIYIVGGANGWPFEAIFEPVLAIYRLYFPYAPLDPNAQGVFDAKK